MPLTPGSSQLPLTPNKQWLYIAHPYTDNILGNTANEDSLLCYAYSQGYTGLFLYQMNYYKTGGSSGNTFTTSASTIFQNFIQKAYTLYNIEVGAAFGNMSTVEAIATYNSSVANVIKSFSTVISEIEWWNFSYNCPFQKPGSTGANGEGAYSTVDTIKSFQDNYGLFAGAGLKLYTYNGWTKAADYEYTSGFEVIASGPDYVTIKGNYTNGGPNIDDNLPGGSKTFQANQVIRIDNFPASGQHSLYKLHATTPTVLVAGNTQLKLASGSNNGRVITGNTVNTVTGISGANNGTIVSKWVSTYTDGGGNVISELFLKTSANHNLTSGSAILYNTVPPFTGLGPQTATTRGADNTGTGSPITTSGTTIKVLSPTLPIISSVQALSGTAIATCSIAHGLQTGDQVLISGISLNGFAGTKTVTVLNTTEFEYSAPAAPNTPQTSTPGGALKVTTMATQASPRLVTPNGTYQANFPVTGKVRLMFEAKSVIPSAGIGSPSTIVLRGNKLAFLQNGITYGSGSYAGLEGYRATRLKIADRTGATTSSIPIEDTDNPLPSAPNKPIYNSATDTTLLFVPFGTTLGTSLIPGFCEGMVNLDIVAEDPASPSSELQQFANNTTVDVYALHDYVSTPNYNYVQSRTIELGNASSPVVVPTKISWIISAESSFSQAYFEGKASVGGAVLYPPKTPIDAYKYISVPLVNPQPAQSNPISTEADAGVQANINVDGVVIFKDDLIRALVSGDGPRIYVNCGPDVTVTTSPGSVPLTVKVCDDCIPSGATYTVTWSIVSQPGSGVITGGTFTTNSCALTTNSSAALNYSNSGTYLLRATVTESNGTSVGQDEVSIRVGTANDPLLVSIINEGSEPTCSNNATLATLTATASNPFGILTAITAPVTFVWSGPNGYSTTTTDNVPPGFTSKLNPPPSVGVYIVVATDAAGRTGTFTYTLTSQYDLSQVFSLNTYPVSCNRGSDGYAEAVFTKYATANNYCSLAYSNFQFYWTRGGAVGLPFGNNTTSPLNSGTISVTIIDCHGCTTTLTGTVCSPTPVGLTATATSSANCGQSSGSIFWSASGGTPPYLYYIYDSSSTLIYNGTNTSLSNLPADVYTVVVQDDNACGRVDTVEIVASGSTFGILWNKIDSEVCSCQEFTATIDIDPSFPGTSPYVVNWSPAPTSTSVVIPNEQYSASFIFDCTNPGSAGIVPIQVQVTDANGCSASLSATVQVNAPVTPVTSITQVFHPSSPLTSCTGSYVELYIQGGTGVDGNWYLDENPTSISSDPNHYNANAIPTKGEKIDLAWWNFNYPGWASGDIATFTWIEFDVNGCQSSVSTTVVAPEIIKISYNLTAVPCNSPSPNVGAIDVTVLTGCPPYTYSWNGPGGFTSSDEDITALITGTYHLQITDDSGNTVTYDIFVPVSFPEIDNASINNNCFGGSQTNGSIKLLVSGGQPPYSYSWSSSTYPSFSSTSSEPKNLGNGSYTVVVTDAYDCTTTETYVINNEAITIDYQVFEPSCWADCNGIIVLDENTLANYDIDTITWYTGSYPHGTIIQGQTKSSIDNLCVGTYSVVVTTTAGCQWVKEFSLGMNFNPTLFTYNVVNLGAGETNTGAIYINTITGGGGPPYDFEWSGPNGYTNNTKDITDLEAGSYTVTIYTGKSCYVTKTFVISTTCPDLSVDELKTALFKFQCCAGILAKQYVQLISVGREDLSDCKITDLKYLTLAIDALSCIEQLPDPSLSCEDISNILNQMSKICSCDCCSNGNGNYNVTYNPVTGQLDTQGFNNLIPEYPPAGSGGNSGGNGGSTGGGTTVITT